VIETFENYFIEQREDLFDHNRCEGSFDDITDVDVLRGQLFEAVNNDFH